MIKCLILILILAALAGGIIYFDSIHSDSNSSTGNSEQTINTITPDNNSRPIPAANKSMMKITSPVFSDGEMLLQKYTCDGEGMNPPLIISAVPDSAQSLVLSLDDPDAPGGNFNHWVVWNIDPKTAEIAEGDMPGGAVSGTNSSGRNGYYPPCPPFGTHRYIFTVYALDTSLNIPASSKVADLEKAMEGHIISQAELMGKYSR